MAADLFKGDGEGAALVISRRRRSAWRRPGQVTSVSRQRMHCNITVTPSTKGLAPCEANPLTYLAPRPGLEPGTYGLTELVS
jgi:hypothetical protein